MRKHPSSMMAILAVLMLILAACNGGEPNGTDTPGTDAPGTDAPEPTDAPTGLEACGDPESGDALLIGVVTDIGQLEDKSFNEGSWCGAITGATAVGGTADVIVTEDISDYSQNIQQFIDEDYDVIVTVGFLIGTDTLAAAEANPDVEFIGVDQFIGADPPPDNYQGLIFAEAQSGYLAGIVAASVSETGVIGAVGGQSDVPPVVNFIAGYANGAASVNPDIEVLAQYAETFTDPVLGRSTAEQLIGQDADVIFQVAGQTGQGALEAACDEGVLGIGVDVDQALALPSLAECIITSAEKKLVNAVAAAIERVADGEVVGGNIVNDATNEGIGLAPFYDFEDQIGDDVQALLDDALEAMADGELDPCVGDGGIPCFGG